MTSLKRTLELAGLPVLNEWVVTAAKNADHREQLIQRIESYFGDLQSLPYDKVSTADLTKMYERLLEDNMVKPLK